MSTGNMNLKKKRKKTLSTKSRLTRLRSLENSNRYLDSTDFVNIAPMVKQQMKGEWLGI